MEEISPIRKNVAETYINTDTAYCFHTIVNLVSTYDNGILKHYKIVQGLYQNIDGQHFIAFWNKPVWNEELLGYEYVDDCILITQSQAKQWVMNYCPEKLNIANKIWEQDEKPASIQPVTIRVNLELRNHLKFLAKISNQSVNKICMDLISNGISVGSARSSVPIPPVHYITMPNGKVALDSFERALTFETKEEQQLANYAEKLYRLWRFSYPELFVFIAQTFYNLMQIEKNQEHAICFAEWISKFHRGSYYENIKNHSKENNQAGILDHYFRSKAV